MRREAAEVSMRQIEMFRRSLPPVALSKDELFDAAERYAMREMGVDVNMAHGVVHALVRALGRPYAKWAAEQVNEGVVVKPPEDYRAYLDRPSVFLAGAIDMGAAEDKS